MKLFLTSNIGGSYISEGKRVPCTLEPNFLAQIRADWMPDFKCLMISADPDITEINDIYLSVYQQAFRLSDLPYSQMDICDARKEAQLPDMIHGYDVLLLAGGHVPTQNKFFNRIHLKDLLTGYEGIIIGISAGSMNCADIVYAPPELADEVTAPNYQTYLRGLGLTDISILPHYQDIKHMVLNGLRGIEDISLPDSKTRPFYALMDGSFVVVNNGKSTVYGEAYLFDNGVITLICKANQSVELIN